MSKIGIATSRSHETSEDLGDAISVERQDQDQAAVSPQASCVLNHHLPSARPDDLSNAASDRQTCGSADSSSESGPRGLDMESRFAIAGVKALFGRPAQEHPRLT
jgi:hypothetical protein